jgi:hypothetical protein
MVKFISFHNISAGFYLCRQLGSVYSSQAIISEINQASELELELVIMSSYPAIAAPKLIAPCLDNAIARRGVALVSENLALRRKYIATVALYITCDPGGHSSCRHN